MRESPTKDAHPSPRKACCRHWGWYSRKGPCARRCRTSWLNQSSICERPLSHDPPTMGWTGSLGIGSAHFQSKFSYHQVVHSSSRKREILQRPSLLRYNHSLPQSWSLWYLLLFLAQLGWWNWDHAPLGSPSGIQSDPCLRGEFFKWRVGWRNPHRWVPCAKFPHLSPTQHLLFFQMSKVPKQLARWHRGRARWILQTWSVSSSLC